MRRTNLDIVRELDEILQLYLPDDYFEDIRTNLIPHLIKWKRAVNTKKINKELCNCVYEEQKNGN